MPERDKLPPVSRAFDRFAAALEDAGLTLVDRDLDQGPRVTFADRDDVILFELSWLDASSPCYARTERFNVSARPLRREGGLDEAGRALVARAIEVLRELEGELAPRARAPSEGRAAVRELSVTRALGVEGGGRYYLNPYVGCMIGCPFCWVDSRSDLGRALEGLPALPWGRWVDVKVNLPDVLREEVRRLPPGPVRISPVVTDPYQPIERKRRVTRGCLEVLLPAGFTPILLTRARRVLDDLPLLARHPKNVAVGVSIPTDDDEVRRAFEPAADPIEHRLEALRALHEAGVVTFVIVQPMLPMNAERLVELVAPCSAAVRLDRMHEVRRALPIYERAGRLDAASASFADSTLARLQAAFRARGVPVDERDDLATLVLEAIAKRA